jgi:anti-sigma B factor antagonist
MEKLITFSDNGGALIIDVLLEKLDLFETPNVLASVEEAIDSSNARGMIINLKSVSSIDSSGVGFLIAVRNKLSKKGIPFSVANPNDMVMQVFRLTKVNQLIPTYATLDEALKATRE